MAVRDQRQFLVSATEPALAWLRLFVVALTGFALILAGHHPSEAAVAWAVLLLAGLWAGTDSALRLYRRFRSLLTRRVYAVLDTTAITLLIALTGGAKSPLFGLYALPLAVIVLQHGVRYGAFYCLGVTAFYAVAVQYGTTDLTASWIAAPGLLWALYLLLGYLTSADETQEARAQRRDELGAMQRAAAAPVHSGDMPTVIGGVLAGALHGPTRCCSASIYLYDEEGDSFTTCYTLADAGRSGALEQRPVRVLPSDILFTTVYRGNPVASPDIHAERRFTNSVVAQPGVRSIILTPLLAPGARRVGILCFSRPGCHRPTQHEMRFAGTIAMQAAVAIHAARLIEEAASLGAAREADKLRSQLLATVSHELRTPIAAIQGFASSLKCAEEIGITKEMEQDWIDEIELNADRLRRLVTDLLDLSRLQAGALRMTMEWHDVNDVVDDLRPNLKVLAGTRNLVIQSAENIPLVRADGERVGQVLSNLVENAAKFSPPDSNLVVGVERYEGGVRVGVLDEGEGIAPEYQEKVFERFFQIEGSSYRRQGGTGLGLAICRNIIEAHGGRIWIESQPGSWTIFYFTLPSPVARSQA